MRRLGPVAMAAALMMASACSVESDSGNASAESNVNAADGSQQNSAAEAQQQQSDPQAVARAQQLAAQSGSEGERAQFRQQGQSEMAGLRIVVDQSDREVRIFRGDQMVARHDVAVGTEKNPTPIGEFAFHRVDLNPRWVPPDSDWAEDREPKPPGDPENPMGRARLVYQMPYTIHGTDNLDSLGKAVSHGSIRLANENVIPLAEMMLKAGGAYEGQQWFQKMVQNRDEEYQVPLEQHIPLTIQQ